MSNKRHLYVELANVTYGEGLRTLAMSYLKERNKQGQNFLNAETQS